jgi:lipid-binding SYLF domain-containing protein
MKTLPRLLAFIVPALLALSGTALQAGTRDTATMDDAIEVLDGLATFPLRCIPPALLRDAQGLAIIPSVIKAGFVVGGRYGRGVLVTRERDGSWGRPEFISLTGGGIGWQVGIQSTDLILVFKTRKGLDGMRKGKLTLGADVAVAAGPVGRQAEADTDALLKAEIVSYSRSRGLFAGVSLEGAALLLDHAATEAYYRHEVGAVVDHQTGRLVPITPPSMTLRLKLTQLTTPPPVPIVAPPPPPPRLEPPLAPPPRPLF